MTEQMHNVLAFISMGPLEWGIVLIVAVLIFGRRLPDIARKAGKSLSEFKKGVKEGKNEISDAIDSPDDEISDGGQSEDDAS